MFSDNEDKMIALLEQIAQNTGSIEGPQTEVNIEGENVTSRVGVISPRDFVLVETDDLDASQADGTIEVQPGEAKPIVAYEAGPSAILALGATDHADMTYQIQVDSQRTLGGKTNSPLGSLNDPFSFPEKLGGAPSIEKRVELVASLDASAPGPVNAAGRLFMEVISA